MSAGDMLTTTVLLGNVNPASLMAHFTRSVLSFTAVSGNPTITICVPQSKVVSIVTIVASMPCTAAAIVLLSIVV